MKVSLLAVTGIAVVSDSLLAPFYPQYFVNVLGVRDSRHVGAYVGASCLTVMLAFPCWAALARNMSPLRLLIYTQIAAGLLSLSCSRVTSVLGFWLLSLAMLVFKASYLLVYPYLMGREPTAGQPALAGVLSVIVHLGSVLGAVLAGFIFQELEPRRAFVVMAAGDFIQAFVCWVIARGEGVIHSADAVEPATAVATRGMPRSLILRLGSIMGMFYFSAFLTRPFFSRHWESVSGLESPLVSGFVFAIPAVSASVALWRSSRVRPATSPYRTVVVSVCWGALALVLQAAPNGLMVLAGRALFGWGLFHSMVRLDVLIFEHSTRDSYATDFSKLSFFQNLGAACSSFAAGALVRAHGLRLPFFVAAVGFMLTAATYGYLLRGQLRSARTVCAS